MDQTFDDLSQHKQNHEIWSNNHIKLGEDSWELSNTMQNKPKKMDRMMLHPIRNNWKTNESNIPNPKMKHISTSSHEQPS